MDGKRAWATLVVVLGVVWLVMLGCAIRFVVLDVGLSSIYAQSGDPYPVVRGARPYASLGSSTLQPGDALIAVNGVDLRGAGPARFFQRAAAPRVEPGAPVVYERDGVRAETHLPLISIRLFRAALLVSLALGASALLLGFRASPTPAIRWGVPAFLLAAIEMAGHPSAAYPFAEVLAPIWLLAVALELPCLICAVTYFPDRDAPELRWVRRWAWLAAVRAPLAASAAYGAWVPPLSAGLPGTTVTAGLALAAVVGILTRNYVLGDAIGRRQLRWTLLGVWIAFLPTAIVLPIVAVAPQHMRLLFDAIGAYAVVPICLVISILRYNWFDVDRLLSATASYNLLGVGVVGVGLIVAPRVGHAASELLGVDPQAAQTVTAFLLAAAVIPSGRRLRPRLEGLFFPERQAVDEGAARLMRAMAAVEEPGALTQLLGEGLQKLYRAESLAVYAPREEDWGVVFAHGRMVPPAVGGAAPLLPALAKRARPLALGEGEGESLTPLDRALLETLASQVLLPVVAGEELALLVCLGPKASGDVYTRTDLALLARVADRAGAELLRFDHERRLRESKEMQESLRRFVPGAVAEQLASGRELSSRECEVSVLFVDIRGYTTWSEDRGAADVFSTVNRYTEIVSAVVTRRGGSVVEFNGDGMMAVFGAPEPLAEKERAALGAARELCDAVAELDDGAVRVGVGVATGPAFVGAIRAVDRLIWSAIGNTTNLAARLQSMTRELGAAVVVDAATRGAAPGEASDFGRIEGVALRGLRERVTLYVLPLEPAPPEPR